MKKSIAAQYVFTNCGQPLRNGVVTYDDQSGQIISVKPLSHEIANTEHYNGVLIPGFANAHCHLELSHMKGLIPPCGHLIDFLRSISQYQGSLKFNIQDCQDADRQMYEAGISLVGDISNTADSAPVKRHSPIHYTTFIELIGTTPDRIARDIDQYNKVSEAFSFALDDNSLFAVPHAPYSVSDGLFNTINQINGQRRSLVSIHNQETEAENELYISHTGSIADHFPLDLSPIKATGKKSLPSYIHHLVDYDNVLLVHNTFSRRDDFQTAVQSLRNPYFVLCPKSNLYLENALPDIDTMLDMDLNICLGTDSLSSNDTLSILEEMKTIRKHFSHIPFEKLLEMATINGARALNQQARFGTIEPGKSPGLVLIENFDFQSMNISDESFVRRIV